MALGTMSRALEALGKHSGALLIALIAGCGGESGEAPVAPGVDPDALMKAGQVSEALEAWQAEHARNPQSLSAAIGAAYGKMLEGKHAEADQVLASVESVAGNEIGGIRVRRALVALEDGDLDRVLEFGQSSGTAEGQVLAAEAALCQSDWEGAKALFEPIASVGGVVGETAATYMERLSKEGFAWAELAEAEACWAMRLYDGAVAAVVDAYDELPSDLLPVIWAQHAEDALVWASRALRQRKVEAAEAMLKHASSVSALHHWRLDATKALVECAKGNVERCVKGLESLPEGTPPLGAADARALGAYLLGNEQEAAAMALLGDDQTLSAAHAALLLGNPAEASRHAPTSSFSISLGDF